MATYTNNSYPEAPAPSFYASAGKTFVGGFPYTLVASSTEEKAFLLRNATGSGKQVQLVDFRASVATLPSAGTATGVILRFYTVEGITGGSGTSATGKNMLLGGTASVATYHTSATSTATATTLLPISLEVNVLDGTANVDLFEKHPLIIPEGYMIFVSVEGPALIVPKVDLLAVWNEI